MKKAWEWLKGWGRTAEVLWVAFLAWLDGEEREQREADQDAREREAWEAGRKAKVA